MPTNDGKCLQESAGASGKQFFPVLLLLLPSWFWRWCLHLVCLPAILAFPLVLLPHYKNSFLCKPINKPNVCPQDVWDKLADEFTGLTCPPPGECHAPKIDWTDCGIVGGGRQCDVCFSITFNDGQPGSDIMCMKGKQCVFTGNLIDDGSYVAVTASLQCTPPLSDPLDVLKYSSCASHTFGYVIFNKLLLLA